MTVAYPYVVVNTDLAGLTPIATRAAGVVAVVGVSEKGNANDPTEVFKLDGAKETFGTGDLSNALGAVLGQSPAASQIYALKVEADTEAGWTKAFQVLEANKDVTLVVAAGKPIKAAAAAGAVDVPQLLLDHVKTASSSGSPRMGVTYLDPELARETDKQYAATVKELIDNRYKSERLVVVAARGAIVDKAPADVAAAAASVIAGLAPETSVLLKRVDGLTIPSKDLFSPTEIAGLAGMSIIPIIDPEFIPGGGLYLGEATTFTDDPVKGYVDIVRLLDDLDFNLKASLIGLIGDARITRSGLYAVRRTLGGVLDGYVIRQAITSYQIVIPILAMLEKPALSANDEIEVKKARGNRSVDIQAVIVIGPAIHRINVSLKPVYAMSDVA